MRVLLVKMSSLGDVVHALIGLTDARRAFPDLTFDWVVEEAFQEIPRWHPAVRRVIPCALRRWRKKILTEETRSGWKQFRRDLARDEYDLVFDAQGLLKSALVARQGRGRLIGRSFTSVREPAAAVFYTERRHVDTTMPEVEQMRQLFAKTFGYAYPLPPAEFGVSLQKLQAGAGWKSQEPYVVFIHGAAWKSKRWAVENWVELGRHVQRRGLKVVLPWGNQEEKEAAEAIAESLGAEVLPKLSLTEAAHILGGARLNVGLDTGLTHISVAFQAPTITLYGPSALMYGQVRSPLVNLTSSNSMEYDIKRLNTVPVKQVISAIDQLLD